MPVIFSCTLALRSSYFLNTSLNTGIALYITVPRQIVRKIIAIRNTILICGHIDTAIIIARISENGARIHILIII